MARTRPRPCADGRRRCQRSSNYRVLLNGSFSTTFTPEMVPVNAFRTFSSAVEPMLPAASSAPLPAAEAASSATHAQILGGVDGALDQTLRSRAQVSSNVGRALDDRARRVADGVHG